MAFTLLLIEILILFNKTEYTINDNDIFNSILSDLTNNVDDSTLRTIVSNIGTAIYKTAKYLASLLAPLSKSEFTINNTKEFPKYIQKQKFLDGYTMLSFDVVSLFTNVALEETIEIVLKRIYINKEITTDIPK